MKLKKVYTLHTYSLGQFVVACRKKHFNWIRNTPQVNFHFDLHKFFFFFFLDESCHHDDVCHSLTLKVFRSLLSFRTAIKYLSLDVERRQGSTLNLGIEFTRSFVCPHHSHSVISIKSSRKRATSFTTFGWQSRWRNKKYVL